LSVTTVAFFFFVVFFFFFDFVLTFPRGERSLSGITASGGGVCDGGGGVDEKDTFFPRGRFSFAATPGGRGGIDGPPPLRPPPLPPLPLVEADDDGGGGGSGEFGGFVPAGATGRCEPRWMCFSPFRPAATTAACGGGGWLFSFSSVIFFFVAASSSTSSCGLFAA